jgi:hypothetical protein
MAQAQCCAAAAQPGSNGLEAVLVPAFLALGMLTAALGAIKTHPDT